MDDDRGKWFRRHPARYVCANLRNPSSGPDTLSRPSIAPGKLSIPWFRWPARLSLFHSASRSANHMQHPNDQASTEKNAPSSEPRSCPRPQGPPEPADPGREDPEGLDEIHRLMQNPVLYDPLRAPRYPIVLCHGAPLLAPRSTKDQRHSSHPRLVWF
jgi:hypothetical protein